MRLCCSCATGTADNYPAFGRARGSLNSRDPGTVNKWASVGPPTGINRSEDALCQHQVRHIEVHHQTALGSARVSISRASSSRSRSPGVAPSIPTEGSIIGV